jgi:hypothetical protein
VSAAVERREASGLCAKARCRVRKTRPQDLAPIGAPPPFFVWEGKSFRAVGIARARMRRENEFAFPLPPTRAARGGEGLGVGGLLVTDFMDEIFRRPPTPEARAAKDKEASLPKRNYPGRRTLTEWRALPVDDRRDLTRRAQCDLLGAWRHCTNKRCRRVRSCSGDSWTCVERAWKWTKKRPKTLRKAYARIGNLPDA